MTTAAARRRNTAAFSVRTGAEKHSIAAEIAGGEGADYRGYDLVMADGGLKPKVFFADKDHDTDWIRDDIEARGSVAVIPARRSCTAPFPVDGYI